MYSRISRCVCGLILGALLASSSWASEETLHRFRVSLAFGGVHAQDEVRNDSANVLTLYDENGQIAWRTLDPRDDAAVSGNYEIQPGSIGTVAWQYGLTRNLLLEGSVGYSRAGVGDVEVQRLPYPAVRFSAGTLQSIPVQLTGLWRFNPKKPPNPYLGIGVGRSSVEFSASPELIELSGNLESSTGQQTVILGNVGGGTYVFTDPSMPERQLSGVTVEAPDPWEWHVVGGAELAFARGWAVLFELRYTQATEDFRIQFDGTDQLGISVPQGQAVLGSDVAEGLYGPVFVFPGGLVDVTGDDVPDSGLYYVTGGELRYDGLAAQVGVRYTF